MSDQLRLVQGAYRRTPAADPDAVKVFVAESPSEYLACRSGNHHWTPMKVDDYVTFWTVVEKCPRCTSGREYDVSPRTGEQYGPKRPHYAEGYLAPAGMGRMGGEGRDMVRLESIKRTMPKPKKPKNVEDVYVHKGTREALGLTGS